MVEELYRYFYRIQIPLPNSPLKSLNSYVIKDGARNLIIDTGLNLDACKKAILEGLAELGIELDTVDLFITHLHSDHFGLVTELAGENYEPHKRIFIAGDHVLYDITPHIQCWEDNANPLQDYLLSLDKVRELDVDQALPGHRNLFENFPERIDELKHHHSKRLAEVEKILAKSSPLNAYEVASEMTWDLTAKNWAAFPLMQKWFATGEAIAHLRCLEMDNRVRRARHDPVFTYELV